MLMTNIAEWSASTFGQCKLGDNRRTKRLVKVVENFASNIGQPVVKYCTNSSEIEGAYRLIRNDQIKPEYIA